MLMYYSMTNAEYLKRIEDGLLEQLKNVSSSKKAAAELIDSLGIRHLLLPIDKKVTAKKAASKKKAAK
jgi:hypothetical protein